MRKSREREGLAFGKEAIGVPPSQALAKAESFVAGQGYVVVHRTLTTMMAVREGSEDPTGHGRAPKVVAVPSPAEG